MCSGLAVQASPWLQEIADVGSGASSRDVVVCSGCWQPVLAQSGRVNGPEDLYSIHRSPFSGLPLPSILVALATTDGHTANVADLALRPNAFVCMCLGVLQDSDRLAARPGRGGAGLARPLQARFDRGTDRGPQAARQQGRACPAPTTSCLTITE